ncbi:MAG: hypothetical protein ABI361_09555 [Nitrososphaera sp.]
MKSIRSKSVYLGAALGAGIAAIIVVLVVSAGNSAANTSTNNLAPAAASNTSGWSTTNRTFWIDTIHLDGSANIYGDSKHPPEPFPVNATYPSGGGFVLTAPDKTGAWNFRSFTFSTSQIVVYQGDKVTLNFVGVQGPSHYIEVQGIASFALTRGQIHTVTFTADKVGTINYFCHVHMPNMRGEIVVLPRPAA